MKIITPPRGRICEQKRCARFRRHHHPNLARKVDVIYALAQAWCSSNDDGDFEMLEKYLSSLKPEETILVRTDLLRIPLSFVPLQLRWQPLYAMMV